MSWGADNGCCVAEIAALEGQLRGLTEGKKETGKS